MGFDIRPASDYPLADLVSTLNLSFEHYLVPVQFNLNQLLTMIRKDGIDLSASRMMLVDGAPSGIAFIARRGWTSRLAAMGVVSDARGKGAGTWLLEQMLRESAERADRAMTLEVIEQNDAAVHVYRKAGFESVRRLMGFQLRDTTQHDRLPLQEVDLRDVGALILKHGLPDLPWQLSGETIAHMTPPTKAYCFEGAYAVISNPETEHVVIWSVLVETSARGKRLATTMLHGLMAQHRGKTWHVPAIYPEEMADVFARAGFEREELSQWQMTRLVDTSA